MVLVDFTLAERWRVFGELSWAPVRAKHVVAARPITVRSTPRTVLRPYVDPQESPAKSHAQAALMQRML
jgi:hypothetical protein